MDMTQPETPKSPEPEPRNPTRVLPTKRISFTNGGLKRHHHAVIVDYRECLKNHAAERGGHALDGCGEFMPSPSATPSDPTSLKCAACGCHRNFHRRDPDESSVALPPPPPPSNATASIEYQPHHRHHPPPPGGQSRRPCSSSPPPISSSYMLLAVSAANNNKNHNNNSLVFSDLNFGNNSPSNQKPGSRKRFRTRFSQYQKEKMHEFAEKIGWKMQGCDGEAVRQFCCEIGVDKGVLKVWMHNHKNTFGRAEQFATAPGGSGHDAVVGETNHGRNRHNNIGSSGGGDAGDGGGGRSLSHGLHPRPGGRFESNTNGSSSSA